MAGAAAQDDAEQLLHLKLAFLAGEPPACILALARKAGGGSITPHVQKFLLENCTDTNVYGRQNSTYTTTIFKRIISEVELSSDIVIDALYEEFAQRMLSKAKDSLLNKTNHIYKEISFLSSTHDNVSSSLISVVARLSCSSNMLEGDTGCSLWPSSLFLSEFILSYPEIFSTKCCFEVILTDGDTSTLTNMKENMELNNVCIKLEDFEELKESKNKVECKYLSWEEASESDLRGYQPDIVLGADIVYDPVCVPHLVRVLSMLLRRDSKQGEVNRKSGDELEMDGPVAYIATVVRNAETFNCFAKAAADAKLSAINIGSSTAPSNFLPYMLSYDRSSVQLLKITLSS
ncbi:hypothetical protein SETIT_3G057600v2 [Setaria italica]|uniref:FAM86 N-terminal domain-containing protein n=1 Tax=Setaria italica TaxID=4555 RepID=A0A368QBU3_SETIT|nr:putative uncharacterized protein DDB_G0277003 isoform X2 [Setaria italica]RCV15455.1 hypothetical protein SETIT_3G057600v2 [Setaria italica]